MCIAAWALKDDSNPNSDHKAREYYNFYKARVAAGDKVILDNGAYEGQLVPNDTYGKMIEDLRPYAYVVPDVIRDHDATLKLERGFPLFPGSQRIFVVHDHLGLIPASCDWIAVPKWWGKDRVEKTATLRGRTNKPIHALGFIDDDPLAELPLLRDLGVQSIDSSHPVWQSMFYPGKARLKIKDNVHHSWIPNHAVDEALAEIFTLCGARENTMTIQLKKPGGKRDVRRPRYDLIPKLWLDELAGVLEEGLRYERDNWKKGDEQFYTDCLNHAVDHLARYNDGDRTENQLAKVAWNVLARRWWDLKQQQQGGSNAD